MKIQRMINHCISIRTRGRAFGLILFLMLSFTITCFLTGCNSTEDSITAQTGKAINVTFDLLSGYDYDKEQIPDLVKSLNGQKVAVTGFMLPIDFDGNKVKSFLLLQNQMACCFGMTPKENEFIQVDMSDNSTAKYMMDWPVTVVGKLEIGKKLLVNSIYRIEAQNVLVTDGF